MEAELIYGFEPIVDKNDKREKILILGSLPGPLSETKGLYYSKPSNRFWKVIDRALGTNLDNEPNWSVRENTLKNNRIVIWDVLHQSKRISYRDKRIIYDENTIFNNIGAFIKEANIKAVIFNGENIYGDVFNNKLNPYICSFKENKIVPIQITSTSGANAYWDKKDGMNKFVNTILDFLNKKGNK